jgi:putative molybdopterin biosynthesis protein
MMPTVPGPPLTRYVSAGADPRLAASAGVSWNCADRAVARPSSTCGGASRGLLTPEGNPSHLTGVAELHGLRVARRQFGAGTRVLLDQLLADAGIPPAAVTGPEAASHLEVAMAIAASQADTGLAVRAAATALGLGFIPLAWENFDIVLSADTLQTAEPLIAALRQTAVQSAVDALGGYDLAQSGTVHLLD